jgi:hypothetical protein
MEVDPAAIAGIRCKMTRAKEHLDWLDEAITKFNEVKPMPYGMSSKGDPKGAQRIYRLVIQTPIPVEWGVVFGEAIHDMRSALDHSIYQLVIDETKRVRKKGTGFPVFTDPDAFRRHGAPQLRGVGDGPRTFVEKLQPYRHRRKRQDCLALLTLHTFWNQDKHRLVHPWSPQFIGDDVELDETRPGACTMIWSTRRMHEGAEVCRIVCDPPDPEVKVKGRLAWKMVVHNPATRGRERDMTFLEAHAIIDGIVEKLLGAIGQQNVPIPL